MSESVLVTFEEKVIPRNKSLYPDVDSVNRAYRKTYEYPNGSTVVVGGMDKPDKIMSTDFDMIIVFEAHELSEDDIEKLTTRLRHGVMPYQQMICDTNPASPTHHLNKRANSGLMHRLLSRHEDNPRWHDGTDWTIDGVKYLAKLDRLTGARLQRLRYGKWAQSEGVVYEGFDASLHLIDRFELPADWRRIRVIDFGFRNPFVCQWWAIDPDGRMFLYRELYGTSRLVEEWAPIIRELSDGESIEVTIADHDAEDRATLEKHGIPSLAACKMVTPGIEAVASRLKVSGDHRPRLFILRDTLVSRCEELVEEKKPCSTIEEFECYMWKKSADGKPVKEAPEKENDHGMDAMRYAVAYVDDIATQQVHVRLISTDGKSAANKVGSTSATPHAGKVGDTKNVNSSGPSLHDDDRGWDELWEQV